MVLFADNSFRTNHPLLVDEECERSCEDLVAARDAQLRLCEHGEACFHFTRPFLRTLEVTVVHDQYDHLALSVEAVQFRHDTGTGTTTVLGEYQQHLAPGKTGQTDLAALDTGESKVGSFRAAFESPPAETAGGCCL